jgi:tetratricopeptide (TPR) repeat protein
VFGRSFDAEGVGSLLGGAGETRPRAVLDEWLAVLVERELLVRHDAELAFRHALVRDAAYAMLTEDDRRLGHRLAAERMEEAIAGGSRESLVIAEHFERGGVPGRAVLHLCAAAEQAHDANDFEGAISLGERAVALGATGETLAGVRLVQAEAHNWRGRIPDATRLAEAAMEAAAPHGKTWNLALSRLAICYGRNARGDAIVELGRKLEPGSRSDPYHARALVRLSVSEYMAGSRAEASRLLELARPIAEAAAEEDPILLGMLSQTIAFRAHHRGDDAVALSGTRACLAAFNKAGDQRNALVQHSNLGSVELELGLYEDAERSLTTALAAAERVGARDMMTYAQHGLGHLCLQTGRLDEALTRLEAARASCAGQGDPWLEGLTHVYIAQIYERRGALDEAKEEAELALALLRGGVGHSAALGTLASVLLARGESEEALRFANDAAGRFTEEGGAGSTEMEGRLVHVRALHACGHVTEARAKLAESLDLLAQRTGRLGEDRLRKPFVRSFVVRQVVELAEAWGLQVDPDLLGAD